MTSIKPYPPGTCPFREHPLFHRDPGFPCGRNCYTYTIWREMAPEYGASYNTMERRSCFTDKERDVWDEREENLNEKRTEHEWRLIKVLEDSSKLYLEHT